jgi:hypothetical protein
MRQCKPLPNLPFNPINMKNITNNLVHFTPAEKEIVDSAIGYEYLYGNGLIYLYLNNDCCIFWDCTNSADAKDYLDGRNIEEVKGGIK